MASVNETDDVTWHQSGDYTDIRYDISGDETAASAPRC
jgi:hypothetical protein